jgi:hypothetical protein
MQAPPDGFPRDAMKPADLEAPAGYLVRDQ